MRTNIRISLILSIAVAFLCLYGCRLRRVSPADPGYLRSAEMYYERIGEDEDVDWDEVIPVYHHWRKISPDDYYFDAPSDEQVGKWQDLCEERNQMDSTSRFYVQGCYANMNQYVTVLDFVELWYHDDSHILDDDLTTWRLMQYDSLSMRKLPDSEFDKFFSIKNTIQGLLLFEGGSQWELNFRSGLEEDFQVYYDRLLVREAVRHSGGALAEALGKEQEAWLCYHAAVDSAFRVIDGDPHGLVGSAWPMAIGGILYDNAWMREISLGDFYFALTDSLDYQFAHKRSMIGEYEIEKHARVSETDVLREYGRFSAFFRDEDFFEPEFSYPLSVLRSALDDEKSAWTLWMASRRKVSSLLEGLCKETYDNATNNVLRYKLIMLKNRYQGYGVISEYTEECLLPYSCDDSEIASFSFEDKWREK